MLKEFRDVFGKNAWRCGPHPFDEDDTTDGFSEYGTDFGEKWVGIKRDYFDRFDCGATPG